MKIPFSDYGLGSGIATDLVNTSPLVQRRTGEALPDPTALAQFLAEHRLRLDGLAQHSLPTDDDLRQVRSLRDDIRTILEASSDDDAVNGANALVARASAGPGLYRSDDHHWQWCVSTAPHASLADELATLVGVGLLATMKTLGPGRFRRCASPTCDGVFVDTSRAGRRRYCAPELCGNRQNVASFRARQRARNGDSAIS